MSGVHDLFSQDIILLQGKVECLELSWTHSSVFVDC